VLRRIRTRWHGRRSWGAAAAVRLVTALGLVAMAGVGCARPVAVAVPTSAPARCAEVVAALPAELAGLHERRTTPASADVQAWGDPPVVVRCGVRQPAGYDPTAGCLQVNRVGWYSQPASGGSIFLANWARPRVEVSVPSRYTPADVLVPVSNAITGHAAHPACPHTTGRG
jgi:hypothetical protein